MSKDISLGQLELEVLKTVWRMPGGSVHEVTDAILAQKEYARTTILTVIQRLHKKGFLSREKANGSFSYYPTETKEDVMGNLAKKFVQTTFEGSASSLIQHLAATTLSTNELAELRDVINKAIESEEDGK